MDPQAALDEMIAIANQEVEIDDEWDRFAELFVEVFKWLRKDGFPPTCKTLGNNHDRHNNGSPRRRLANLGYCGHQLAIQTQDYNSDEGPYEFVEYNTNDRVKRKWLLPMS